MSNSISVLVGTGIKEEEDWTGFLVRQSALSSADSYRGLTVFQEKLNRTAFVHPSRLEQTSRLFTGVPRRWERIVMQFTRYRLNSSFLSDEGKGALLEHHRTGLRASAHGLLGMNRWASRARLAICLGCFKEDLAMYGFPIWHRLHLMPSILYCPQHEEPLRTFCRTCDKGHRRGTETWVPTGQCLCGKPLLKIANLRTKVSIRAAIAIAKMSDEVLKGKVDTTGFTEHVAPVLRAALWRHKNEWCIEHGKLATTHIQEALGQELCAVLAIGQVTLRRMSGRYPSFGPLRNPIQNIAAIWSYFGDFEAFVREVNNRRLCPQSYDETARPSPKRIRPGHTQNRRAKRAALFEQASPDEKARLRDENRASILELFASHPEMKRSGIGKQPGGKAYYEFALKHDAAWLDRVSARRWSTANSLKNQRLAREQDDKLAQLVWHRYLRTVRSNPVTFISRAFLLDNTVMEAASRNKRRPSPKLDALVERCVDDVEKWTERQVKNITRAVSRIDKNCRWADAKNFEAPNRRGVCRRLNEARKWLRDHCE
jgi:hypothetical protein